MRTGISFTVNSKDRARMEAIVSDRDSSQKHVWRCRIVLFTAVGAGTHEIMRTAAVSKTVVWGWQERFMQEGVSIRPHNHPVNDVALRFFARRPHERAEPQQHRFVLKKLHDLLPFAQRLEELSPPRFGIFDNHFKNI